MAEAGFEIVEALIPKIQQLGLTGQITKEKQQALLARYTALKAAGDQAFSGSEWQITP